MTTEKALREALQEVTNILDAVLSMTGGYLPGADGLAAKARAALALPETQGEPVAGDVEWLHKFINCTPFGADAPAEDIQRAHRIVDLLAAPPSQPAQGEPVAWMNTAGRVISAKEKINAVQLISEGGEFEIAGKAALSYSIRLGVIK